MADDPVPQLVGKVCTKEGCIHNKDVQPLSNFYEHPTAKDGHTSWCKDCMKASARKHQESAQGHKVRRKYHKEHRNSIEQQARRAVRDAIREGTIKKPGVCFRCKNKASEFEGVEGVGPLSFHHTKGYDKAHWLTGEFLCRACHEKGDKELGV